MSTSFRYSLRFDAARNVVYMRQEGTADRADMEPMRDDYRRRLADVRPGWILVNDQSGVRSFTDAALEVGKELVALTNDHAPRAVIRVGSEGFALRTRITRVLVTGRSRYRNLQVATPEEAEAKLAELLAEPGA